MRYSLIRRNRSRINACILVFSIFLHSFLSLPMKQAEAANDYWLKTVPNAYQRTMSIMDSKIIQEGRHNPAKDGIIRYRTTGYLLSKVKCNTNIKFTSGSNATIQKEPLNGKVGQSYIDGDGLKVTPYTINMKDFVSTAAKLGITGEYVIQNGGASIYMHNVFESYLNDATRKTPLIGKQEFLAAEYWSQNTINIIDSYYNYEFKLTPEAVYDIEVIAVDSQGNSLNGAKNANGNTLNNPLYTKPVIYNEDILYTLSNANKKLQSNIMQYVYSHYEYTYTNRTDGKNTKSSKVLNATVDFNAPDAKSGTTLTVTMVYEPEDAKPYMVNVVAVDTEGKRIKQLQDYKEVSFGSTFKFTVGTSRYTLNDINNYQHKYYLTYTNRDPEITKTTPTISGTDINYKMPDAKANDKATFFLVYDTSSIPTPTPAIPPVVVPEPDFAYLEFTDVVNTGRIRADLRGAERFVAPLGIPTTESLFGEVTAKEYLLGYHFVKKVGIKHYVVSVRKDYTLEWMSATPEEFGGGEPITETITVQQRITVPRAYGYWEIENLECYKIDNAILRNYALPNGSVTIYPNNSYYNPPSVVFNHSSSEEYHIIKPAEVDTGITLPGMTITGNTNKPSIPSEDFTEVALSQTGNIRVRSDSLSFRGSTVISDQIVETDAPDINTSAILQCESFINQNVLYKNNQIIEATKQNGTYPSTGTITYTALAKVGSIKPDRPQYSIDGLNKVVIHTPVVCIPSITADNDRYVQLINPKKDCVQLILDPDPNLSDFIVNISNTGHHSGKQGYYIRDFSRALRDPAISYILSGNWLLMNQVKFPFDVYIDVGSDNNEANDDYILAGTWISIGRSSPRFYLPMTTVEDVYTVNFRTIAVNGAPFINKTQDYANTDLINYVATETLNVEVSGRIYGLTMYDLSDYPMWEEAFRIPKSKDFKKDDINYPVGTSQTAYNKDYSYTYSIGTNDQYGNDTGRNIKYTFPLVNGSHPRYKNIGILKTGYLTRFSLETTGNMFSDGCKVSIKPSFYFVDKEGKNRTAVDLYYTEAINGKTKHLVKVGSGLDQTNLKSVRTGDLYLKIPENELKQTAALRNMTYSKFIAKWSPMFNFSDIRLNSSFRTYVNEGYTAKVKSYASYEDVQKSGIKEKDITLTKQRWYGQYYIPNEVHVVAKGYDVMDYLDNYGVDYSENFWLKDGYIIVNFNIETVDEDGNRRLSYTNASNYLDNGNCSMWSMEGPSLTKSSYKGPTFNFYAGDFIIYYANKRMTDDYSSGAIY